MWSLHYEIVFKRVTKVDEIRQREHELEINPHYIGSLPKDIKEAIAKLSLQQEEVKEPQLDLKDHVILPSLE